jgi:hypothetical protein
MAPVDAIELETKVKNRYRHVAEQPHGAYHFETGRALAERFGYPADLLDRIPGEAIESFAGSATSSMAACRWSRRSSLGRSSPADSERRALRAYWRSP